MALVDRPYLSITLVDGVGRSSVWQAYITLAEAQAYVAAANQGARDATPVGVLAGYLGVITQMAVLSTAVCLNVVNTAIGNVADTVLRGNKWEFFFNGDGRSYVFTVPGRDDSKATQSPNSLGIAIDAPTDMDNFVSQYNTVARSINGGAVEITKAVIVD
mgnify:CR=1 FL=1